MRTALAKKNAFDSYMLVEIGQNGEEVWIQPVDEHSDDDALFSFVSSENGTFEDLKPHDSVLDTELILRNHRVCHMLVSKEKVLHSRNMV